MWNCSASTLKMLKYFSEDLKQKKQNYHVLLVIYKQGKYFGMVLETQFGLRIRRKKEMVLEY